MTSQISMSEKLRETGGARERRGEKEGAGNETIGGNPNKTGKGGYGSETAGLKGQVRRRVFMATMTGILTTFVYLLAYYIIATTILDPQDMLELQMANLTSWATAVAFAYFANRTYVFKSKNRNILKEGLAFGVSRLTTLFIEMLFMFVTVSVMNLDDKIMKLAARFLMITGNFAFNNFIVFRKKAEKGKSKGENQGK